MLISNLLMPALKTLLKKLLKILIVFSYNFVRVFFKGGINEFVIGISDTDIHKLTGLSDSKTYVFLCETYIQFYNAKIFSPSKI
jgi:hypothetical protein